MDDGLGFISKTIALKQRNPKLKVLAVVGGWNEGSTKYSAMAADPAKRATFISSTLAFIRQHGFDGLDLDWEYPGQRGGSSADRANFVTLLREIKEAFAPHGLELGIAVGASEASAAISYDIPAISEHLTFINVMTYDFHMAMDGYLGFNAPYPEVEKSIDYWLSQGAPAEKLILGIGFYGHSYQMADSSQNQPGAPCRGPGEAGPYTRERGFMGYHEICQKNWQTVFDGEKKSPYAFSGDQWIGYDNVQSIELKMQLVQSRNLGGAMTWSIETDDFRGLCGETYPLLKAMNRGLGVDVGNGGGSGGGGVTAAPTPKPTTTPTPTSTLAPTGTPTPTATAPPTPTPILTPTTTPTWSPTTTPPPTATQNCARDGFFMQEGDCNRFFRCVNGVRYNFTCPSGLYFDIKTNTCNWPSLVKCLY
ncbi:uncharacterized protein Dmoj_GI18891 [Drosophila mojavensis]|uniref:chitinase n=3 Tax=Drosophila mojavensis TaxID=7230 RepID=B4KUB4_DROMO|nr:uncharacterized protein Dmoj_GI18891 [Drosophila mojavensis]